MAKETRPQGCYERALPTLRFYIGLRDTPIRTICSCPRRERFAREGFLDDFVGLEAERATGRGLVVQ